MFFRSDREKEKGKALAGEFVTIRSIANRHRRRVVTHSSDEHAHDTD